MIPAVIFDLDGTLIHSLPGLCASLNRVLEKNSLPVHPEKKVRTFIGNGIHKLVQRAVPDDFEQTSIQALCDQMSQDYASTWKTGTSPYPGITETLKQLSDEGVALAVFSNKPHIFCREMTDFLFSDITFASVLGQREGGPTKPDPAGALDTARSLGCPPEKIAFLGDSTIDIATAKNADMIDIAASWGYHDLPALEAEQPAHLIHDIHALIPLLRKLA
jgi:phosphoglycolate phosphatase